MPFGWVIDVWFFLVIGSACVLASFGVVPVARKAAVQEQWRLRNGKWVGLVGVAMILAGVKILIAHQ